MYSMNSENYYSSENALKYMSVSQFKSFMNCEAKAIAEISGEYKRESTTALLIGSYIDSWFEGTLDSFKSNHNEIFLKNGGLKADFAMAEDIIKLVSSQPKFMQYMSGEKQKIFTGNIAGVSFKGKLDSYIPGKCIVDLKVMRDFEPVWKDRHKLNFVEAWGYDIQGAVYQELVYQNTGERLPFYICAVTKEKVPDIRIMKINQERLDYCLAIVKGKAPYYHELKTTGGIPKRCEKCDYCKMIRVLEVIDYRDLTPELYSNHNEEEMTQNEDNTFTIKDFVEIPGLEIQGEKHDKKDKKKKKIKKQGKKIKIELNFKE